MSYRSKLAKSPEKLTRFSALNPAHPSLNFKRVHGSEPVYSVRVARCYRALGLLEGGEITWFWIGSHDNYDRLIASL